MNDNGYTMNEMNIPKINAVIITKNNIDLFLLPLINMRIADINNRIEGHLILNNSEITTDGITLGFNKSMNMNPSHFKRLGIRKIKCEISENPGYLFYIEIVWYDRSQGVSEMRRL
jgi:hypothetical protein